MAFPSEGIALRAITVVPGLAESIRLDEIAEAPLSDGPILARTLALGICGTDREIVAGVHGQARIGHERLVLGHESLGEVIEAPADSEFAAGDRVVGIVRRPDPVPCPACASGEWDMCRNGRYTERGIKGRDGYGAEYFRIEPEYAVRVDSALGLLAVLTEPASVVAKAWDHIEQIGRRFRAWQPRQLLVTGAGPVGLLAALMGAQRGLDLHVLDRRTQGPKAALIRELGGQPHAGSVAELTKLQPDIVMECTGAPTVIADVLNHSPLNVIVCLLGIGGSHVTPFDIGQFNRAMVIGNKVVFGSVNANRRHYCLAVDALARADKNWLARLISCRVPLSRWQEALERRPGDIKVVIDFTT
jgi:threonine dehydrogenase-like Zn-dependent dehydrogenase